MGEFLKAPLPPTRRKKNVTQTRKSQQSLKLSGGDHYSQKPLHRGLGRLSTQDPSREKTEHARRGVRMCKKTTGVGGGRTPPPNRLRGECVTPRDEQLPAWRGGVARAAEAAAGPGRGAALGPLGATRDGGRAPDAHDLAGPEGGR